MITKMFMEESFSDGDLQFRLRAVARMAEEYDASDTIWLLFCYGDRSIEVQSVHDLVIAARMVGANLQAAACARSEQFAGCLAAGFGLPRIILNVDDHKLLCGCDGVKLHAPLCTGGQLIFWCGFAPHTRYRVDFERGILTGTMDGSTVAE